MYRKSTSQQSSRAPPRFLVTSQTKPNSNRNLFTRDDYSPPSRMVVSATKTRHLFNAQRPINATLSECTGVNLNCCFGFLIFTTETACVDVVRGPYQPATVSKMDWKHAYIQLQTGEKTVKISHTIQHTCCVMSHTHTHTHIDACYPLL